MLEHRLVHVSYARDLRGGSQQMILLVRELAKRGLSQVVVCHGESQLHDEIGDAADVRLVRAAHHALDGLRLGGGAIWHAHEAKAVYAAWASHLRFGTPYIITRRVLNPLSRTTLATRAHGSATSLVGVSNAVCDLIRQETGRPAIRILDAHRELKPALNEVARIRREISGGPIVGQVATLKMDRKGQHHLIAAFKKIKSRFPDARLVLLGTGPDEAALRRQAEGVEGVLFAGQRSNIADWTAALDLVAYPSRMDALASSLLDAMHLGIPVVANRVGGIPEIAEHGVRALLVDYGDIDGLAAAALQLLENPSLRERLVRTAHAFAAGLAPATMASEYLRVYCEAERRWIKRQPVLA